MLNTHACTSVDIRSKQKHGGGNKVQTIHRTIAPNIRTIHRNSTWLQRKSNYAVPIRHTTLFLFPTNHKFKNPANFSAGSREKILFAKHEPGSSNHPLSCKHLANANVKPLKNTENTMKFPPTKRLRMDIHDLNICYPSCKLIPTHGKPPRQTQHVAISIIRGLTSSILVVKAPFLGKTSTVLEIHKFFCSLGTSDFAFGLP